MFVGFGGVVEHHVQHHLETFCLQCGDHRAEFSDGRADIIIPAAAASRVACVGAEEADGVVAPIVVQAAFVHAVFVDGGVDGQQRQRGHAETLEMRDRRRLRQPGIGATQRVGDAGQRHRETLDVQLVQHEFRQRTTRTLRGARCGRRRDPRLQCKCGVVASVEHACAFGMALHVGEVFRAPVEAADNLAGIGIKQQFVRVEAIARFRLPGAVRAIAVDQAWLCAGQYAGKYAILGGVQGVSFQFMDAVGIEYAQLNPFRALREHGELDAAIDDMRAERRCAAGEQMRWQRLSHCLQEVL